VYSLTIRQTGAEEIRTMMNRLLQAVDDISPAFPEMEATFRAIELQAFTSEGTSGESGAWAPLSPGYRAWKERHFPGKTILRRTDRLMGSLVRRGADSFIESSPKRLAIGTTTPYAAFHQVPGLGARFRPPISLTDRDAAKFQAILHRFFSRTIQQSLGQRVSVQRALVGA
jgi:phage gpG-like protein